MRKKEVYVLCKDILRMGVVIHRYIKVHIAGVKYRVEQFTNVLFSSVSSLSTYDLHRQIPFQEHHIYSLYGYLFYWDGTGSIYPDQALF